MVIIAKSGGLSLAILTARCSDHDHDRDDGGGDDGDDDGFGALCLVAQPCHSHCQMPVNKYAAIVVSL